MSGNVVNPYTKFEDPTAIRSKGHTPFYACAKSRQRSTSP